MSEETRVSFRWDPLVDVYRPLAFHLGVLWSCDFFFLFLFFFSFLFSFFSLVVGFLVVLQVLLPADDWMIGWVRCAC